MSDHFPHGEDYDRIDVDDLCDDEWHMGADFSGRMKCPTCHQVRLASQNYRPRERQAMTDTARILQLVIEELSARAGVLGCAGVRSERIIGTALAEVGNIITRAIEAARSAGGAWTCEHCGVGEFVLHKPTCPREPREAAPAPTRPTRGEEVSNGTYREGVRIDDAIPMMEMDRLFEAIQHGDAEHRDWLRKALNAFAVGGAVEPPRGKNSADVIRTIQQWANGEREVQDGEDAEAALKNIDAICIEYLRAAPDSPPGADSQAPNIDALNRVARPEEPARAAGEDATVAETSSLGSAAQAAAIRPSISSPVPTLQDASQNVTLLPGQCAECAWIKDHAPQCSRKPSPSQEGRAGELRAWTADEIRSQAASLSYIAENASLSEPQQRSLAFAESMLRDFANTRAPLEKPSAEAGDDITVPRETVQMILNSRAGDYVIASYSKRGEAAMRDLAARLQSTANQEGNVR